MTKKAIFFDLDGTLTDSGEGIINSVILALEHFGIPVPPRDTLGIFVGPPLDQSFVKYGIPPEKTDEAIRIFRSRYNTVGVYENYPYPGIHDLLKKLKAQGHRLFVATSKPEETAILVLNHFGLAEYFEQICGATPDSSRVEKADVIAYLFELVGAVENTVMVGDTAFDVIGAAQHGIPTIGVSWGYGSTQGMLEAGAVAIADTPDMLLSLLQT